MIGSIDDSGYIRRPLLDIMDDLAFTQNFFTDEKTIESALKIVHQLDPAGVGARNLQECLALQLLRKTQTANTSLAKDIINSGFDQFTKKHYQKLKINLEKKRIEQAKTLSSYEEEFEDKIVSSNRKSQERVNELRRD